MNSIHPARIIGLANSSVDVYTLSFSGYSKYHLKSFDRHPSESIQMKNIIKHIKRNEISL